MRVAARRALNATLLTIAVTATTAGCGVSGIRTMADTVRAETLAIPLPLDGKSASQIATMSLKDLGNATSVRYTGTGMDSGQRVTVTITVVKGVGCTGNVKLHKQGSVQLVVNVKSKTAWMKGDDTFWTAQGATGSAMNTLADNYIKVTKSSFVTEFSGFCQIGTGAATGMTTGLTKTRAFVNNRAVVKLKKTSNSETMVVTNTTTPEILQMSKPGSDGGSFTFSGFNQPATIAAPPTDQTLDGAQFGL